MSEKQSTNKKITKVHFSCQERENKKKTYTIDHQRQSNNDMFTRTAPCESGHECAFSDMSNGQI